MVGAGEHEQGAVDHHVADGIVGALVHQEVVAVGREVALAVRRQLDPHVEGMALRGHQHALGQAGDIADRPFEMDGGRPGDALGDHIDLDAELAAGVGLDVAHVLPAESGLQHAQMEVDVDAAADDHQLVVFARVVLLPVGDRGFGFQRRLVVDLGLELGLDHRCRALQGRFRIALDLRLVETQIGELGVELNRARRPAQLPGCSGSAAVRVRPAPLPGLPLHSARVSAATARIGSPIYRTLSLQSTGRSATRYFRMLVPLMSAAVSTPATPGIFSA